MSAETFVNYRPRVLGSMMLRPGFGYIGQTYLNGANGKIRNLPFVFASDDTSMIEMSAGIMRIWINDVVLTRPATNSAVTNGTFTGNIVGWTDASDVGGAIAYAATNLLALTGNGTARAIARQQVAVNALFQGIEHGLKVIIERGPVSFRIGSAAGLDDYFTTATLDTGQHSLSFTPGASFWVEFESTLARVVRVSNCTVEIQTFFGNPFPKVVQITTPYTEADLANLRIDQSADVIFIACAGFQQRKIERRGTRPGARSWSFVLYKPDDGPFLLVNTGATTITPSALTGNGTLTASRPLFKSTHVGALFEVDSQGQQVVKSIAAENTFSNAITVTGVGTSRQISIDIAGTFVATVTLQRSPDNVTWTDVQTWTTPQHPATYTDGLDNQIIYYRVGVKVGNYTSGTVNLILVFAGGSIRGICRVVGFTSSTVVDMEVLKDFGGTVASLFWNEGAWSDQRGWPTSVGFHEGRLCWAGKNGIWASVSDGYTSFDEDTIGDSGPIARTVGSGPVDIINWILSLQRMVLGAQGAEISCRSNNLDEPLTPTNFNLKASSTQGSAAVEALKIDHRGIFVQRGGTRVFEITLDYQNYAFDYSSTQLTALIPEIGQPSIVRLGLQRQIDSIVHAVRSDGIVAQMLYDKVEQVNCWYLTQSDGAGGLIEDICVLPKASPGVEDQVYIVTKRTVNGATVRYLEKQALESECIGGSLCKLADAHLSYSGVPITVVTGLDHLEGQKVVVWADGVDVGTNSDGTLAYTVAGGQITLVAAASNIVVGLPYTAQWKSGKLVQLQSPIGSSLPDNALIGELGLIMANVHAKGVKYGPDFDNLDDLPGFEEAALAVDPNAVRATYDSQSFPFAGSWFSDSRICLQSKAPRPAIIQALIAEVETSG